MNRLPAIIVGLFLGLVTFTSFIGMFANAANMGFWATGFSVSITLLLLWALARLYVITRPDPSDEASAEPTSFWAWLSIIPIAAFAVFLFSLVRVIAGGATTGWINAGIGAFIVSAITAPIVVFVRGMRTHREVPATEPAAEDVEPFVEEETLPFSLSDLSAAPDEENGDLDWPYPESSDFAETDTDTANKAPGTSSSEDV